MTVALDSFQKLQSRVNALQREADQAKGAISQLQADLKKEFGVSSLEDGKKLLDKLEKQEERLAAEYGELREQFTNTYGHLLEGES